MRRKLAYTALGFGLSALAACGGGDREPNIPVTPTVPPQATQPALSAQEVSRILEAYQHQVPTVEPNSVDLQPAPAPSPQALNTPTAEPAEDGEPDTKRLYVEGLIRQLVAEKESQGPAVRKPKDPERLIWQISDGLDYIGGIYGQKAEGYPLLRFKVMDGNPVIQFINFNTERYRSESNQGILSNGLNFGPVYNLNGDLIEGEDNPELSQAISNYNNDVYLAGLDTGGRSALDLQDFALIAYVEGENRSGNMIDPRIGAIITMDDVQEDLNREE